MAGAVVIAALGVAARARQTAYPLSPDGKVSMMLGTGGVAGNGPDTFDRPTGVAIAPNGDIKDGTISVRASFPRRPAFRPPRPRNLC